LWRKKLKFVLVNKKNPKLLLLTSNFNCHTIGMGFEGHIKKIGENSLTLGQQLKKNKMMMANG